MKKQTNEPTESGWYWARRKGFNNWEIVYYSQNANHVLCAGYENEFHLPDFEWGERIERRGE